MSEYDGDIAAKSSVYSETESSMVSAENNAMYHENESRRKREDKEMRLHRKLEIAFDIGLIKRNNTSKEYHFNNVFENRRGCKGRI